MSLDNQILSEFVAESKRLVNNLIEILDEIEGDFSQVKRLEEYGNLVDRIMGGAQSLAVMAEGDHAVHIISDYTALCKAVAYKAAQIQNNSQFYDICVALLQDATETLQLLCDKSTEPAENLRKSISNTFIERLRWVSSQFSSNVRASVSIQGSKNTMSQNDIDDLMKKLGLN